MSDHPGTTPRPELASGLPSADALTLGGLLAQVEGDEALSRPYDVGCAIGDYFNAPQRYQHPGSQDTSHLPYCTSIDAALVLCERVLPGWSWRVERGDEPKAYAYLWRFLPKGLQKTANGRGATPPLALLAALLKALIAHGDVPRSGSAEPVGTPSPGMNKP